MRRQTGKELIPLIIAMLALAVSTNATGTAGTGTRISTSADVGVAATRSATLRVAIIPDGQDFICTPIAVWDGDGPIWCVEGPHVRLQGVAAREIDGSCRDGQPCPTASGVAARDALVALLGGAKGRLPSGHVRVAGPRLTCRSSGSARGNRTAALCRLPDGRDLSCTLVRDGTVLRWTRYGGNRLCR